MTSEICGNWKVREQAWSKISSGLASLSNIYIWGSSGTGKTLLSKSILSFFSINYLYLNCIEYFTFKSIFKSIKISIFETFSIPEFKNNEPLKVALYLSTLPKPEKFYLILDKAEKLLSTDLLFIHKLQEFGQISGFPLRFIVITESYIEDLFIHPNTIDRDFSTIKVFLPEYGPEDLRTIIRKQYLFGDQSAFEQFFDLIHLILSPYTSKIFHFQHGFEKCYELFLNIDPDLPKEKKLGIVARELGNIENSFFQKSKICREYQHGLSTDAKILVICGFICSKNPPKLDAILLKGRKKTEKRRVRREFSEQVVPEKFSLQRLQGVFSIFNHLVRSDSSKLTVEFEELETPSFCSLFNTLTQKKLFVKVSKKDPLGNEKFMCTAEYEFCRNLSQELGIKLEEYVIDMN